MLAGLCRRAAAVLALRIVLAWALARAPGIHFPMFVAVAGGHLGRARPLR